MATTRPSRGPRRSRWLWWFPLWWPVGVFHLFSRRSGRDQRRDRPGLPHPTVGHDLHVVHRPTPPRTERGLVADDAEDVTEPVPRVGPSPTVPRGDAPDTTDPLLPADRFELRGRIGAGNHGVVFRALDRHLGRVVAIKRFSHFLADDPRAMRRITREVETLARVSHPNVVTVHDLVHMPDGDGEVVPHLVMELVEGTSMRDLLLQRGPSVRSVHAVLAVLDGLAACHRAGILHLDIKPANVLVTAGGGVKIVDFGIARAASDATATVAGTPHYMAPEQYDGRADERSDVYSVGCLLHECLTGRPPFEGTMAAQLLAHRSQPRPDPRVHAPEVSSRLAAVVVRAMAVDPDERYPSTAAMSSALESAVGDGSDLDVAAGPPTAATLPVAQPVVAAPLVQPLSRPADLGDRREPLRPEPVPSAVPGATGPAVSRWTRLVALALGLAGAAAVVAFVPMLLWATIDLVPFEQRPPFMDGSTADAWWMVAVAAALLFLLPRRREFLTDLAGPPVGAPLPDGPLSPTVGRGIRSALAGTLLGSTPMLLPWYVLGLGAALTAGGIGWPDDPFGTLWSTAWVFAPLVAMLAAGRGVMVVRLRFGAMAASFLYLGLAAGATVYFVLVTSFVL